MYWKKDCFGLSAEALVDKAVELKYVGGMMGEPQKPSEFICLILKMLQIQPDKEIIIEFIKNDDYKYVRLLGEGQPAGAKTGTAVCIGGAGECCCSSMCVGGGGMRERPTHILTLSFMHSLYHPLTHKLAHPTHTCTHPNPCTPPLPPGAYYLRLVGKAYDVYTYLEPLYNDFRRVRVALPDGRFALSHVDEVVDDMLRKDYLFDVALPHIPYR